MKRALWVVLALLLAVVPASASFEVPACGGGAIGFTNTGLGVDGANLIVGDFTNGRIVTVTPSGVCVSAMTLASSPAASVQGVYKDGNGDYWVAHYSTPGGGSVRRYNSSGTLLQNIGLAIGQAGPNAGLYVDLTNTRIYTTWEDGHIRGFDTTTGTLEDDITVTGLIGTGTGLLDGLTPDFTSPASYFWITADSFPPQMAKIDRATGAASSISYLAVNVEGMAWSPAGDATFYLCMDQGFHSSLAHGNRIWHLEATTANDLDGDLQATNLTVLNQGGAANNTYTTASVTPTANRLQLAFSICTRTTTPAGTPTATGNSLTWDQIGTFLESGQQRRITGFRATGTPTAGSVAMSFAGVNQTGCVIYVEEVWGKYLNVTSNGANAIVANAGSLTSNVGTESSGTLTGISQTISPLSCSHNLTLGIIRNNTTATISAGAGYLPLASTTATLATMTEFSFVGSTTIDYAWSSQSVTTRMTGIEIASSNPVCRSRLLTLGVTQ